MQEQNSLGQEGGKKQKIVKMPEREVIMRKLQDSGVLGISEQTNSFFGKLAETLGDREIVGAGINLTWELTKYDTMRDYPPIVQAGLDISFDRVIDAITPDPEVAEEAKEARRKILEEIARRMKAAEPKPEALGPEDSLRDYDRFSQAIQVREIMRSYTEGRSERESSLQDDNNPYYRQTHRGFFLEYYYGSPNMLWSPWGEFRLSGEVERFTGDRDEFLKRLGATVHKPEVNNKMGSFGPIYAVHKIDDVDLPDPVERPRSVYKPSEEVDTAWNQLARKHYESQGQNVPLSNMEKLALDNDILEARGENELPINEHDIRTLKQLDQYRGKIVKYTYDGGKTWRYTKITSRGPEYFRGGSFGYNTNEEVLPNAQTHGSHALTDDSFKKGLVARPTSDEETKDMKFSYELKDFKR